MQFQDAGLTVVAYGQDGSRSASRQCFGYIKVPLESTHLNNLWQFSRYPYLRAVAESSVQCDRDECSRPEAGYS